MGVEVPGWVGRMFQVVTGDAWPAADEDEVRDLAGLWFTIAAEFQRFAPEVADAADCLVSSGVVAGNAQAALRNTVGIVTGEGGLTVEKLAAGFEEMGRFLHGVALQVQYMKIIVIEELIILGAEVAYLVAMIPWTFGASAAGVGALQVLGREFARQVLRQVAFSIATSVVLQVGLDVVAQVAQMAEGWRGSGEWDGELTRSAAVTGVVGGVLGPVFVGLGYFPARWLGRVVGRDVGEVGANVVKGAGHEYVTDGVSGWVQDGRWRPDRFSATAGGLDEGITSVAGVGRRKRSLRGSLPVPGGGSLHVPGGGSLHVPGGVPGGAGGVGVPGPVTLPGDGSPFTVPDDGQAPGAVSGVEVSRRAGKAAGAGKVAGEENAVGAGKVGGGGRSSRGGVVDGVTAGVVTNVNAVIRGGEPDLTVVWRPDVRTVGEGVTEPGDPSVPVPAGNLPEREWAGQEQEWTTAEQVWAAAGQAWVSQEQEWTTDQELTVPEQAWGPAGQAWTGQEQERAAAEQVSAPAAQARTGQEQEWTDAEQEWVARVWAPAERGLAGEEQEWAPAWQARTGQEQEWTDAEQEWTAAEQEWVAMVWAAEQTGTSEGSGDGVEVVDAMEVRRGEVAVVEPGGGGVPFGVSGEVGILGGQESASPELWASAASVGGVGEMGEVGGGGPLTGDGDGDGGGTGGRWWSMMREALGEPGPEWELAALEETGGEPDWAAGGSDVDAAGGGDSPSGGGVARGQFADDGAPAAPGTEAEVPAAPTAPAAPGVPGTEAPAAPGVPGTEAEVPVIAAGSWLVSQEEGVEARLILRDFRLGQAGSRTARKNVLNWVGSGRPSGQGWRGGELEGVFASWVALSALPTSGKADPGPLAVARQALGRTVVGALWRSVEAAQRGVAMAAGGGLGGETLHGGGVEGLGRGVGLGEVPGVARRVAVAVAEQVPSTAGSDRERIVVAGIPLTAGLVSAFIDQTVAAGIGQKCRSCLRWWSGNTGRR